MTPPSKRDVYCLLGLPLDAVTMDQAIALIRNAVRTRTRLFLSTPNLNFLIGSRQNAGLRDSVIHSDLSVADGMPLVWMSRMLRLPIRERVAGSGLFERLVRDPLLPGQAAIRVYFFGGPPGAAALAHERINALGGGVVSVGHVSPGFGTIEAMSGNELINDINASGADFLLVALGAAKGQAWIEHNLDRLTVPVVSHLGAVVNFVAGSVSRAPVWIQRAGLEWLWRIKEEPGLWRRYWGDGRTLLTLLVTRLLPYAVWLRFQDIGTQLAGRISSSPIGASEESSLLLSVSGDFKGTLQHELLSILDQAAAAQGPLRVDLAGADGLGAAFWAHLLLLRARVRTEGRTFALTGLTPHIRRQMRWNGVEYLLEDEIGRPPP